MANEMQGISALDPRVAATDQFISEKQIPPEQVPAFLMQMGADPRMVGLVFKYQRLKDAAAKQQGPAPTSTVAQDVDQQYAQMQGGLGSLPAPVMENAQFQGGIAPDQEAPPQAMAGGGIVAFSNGGASRLPAVIDVTPEGQGVVNRQIIPYEDPVNAEPKKSRWPKIKLPPSVARFMGTGAGARLITRPRLAALALLGYGGYTMLTPEQEAEVEATAAKVERDELTDEQRALLASFDQDNPMQMGSMEMPERPQFQQADLSPFQRAIDEYKATMPKTREEAIAQQRAMEEEIGEGKAIQARRTKLEEQMKKAEVSDEKRFWLAFAKAGFAASAKGARNLWETLSMGGEEGLKAYQAMKDKEDDTRERLEDKLLQLDSMEAAIKRGVITRGDAEFKQARKDVLDLQNKLVERETINADVANRFNLGIYGADMQAAIAKLNRADKREFEGLQRQYARDVRAAQTAQDPKVRAALETRAAQTLEALSNLAEVDPSVIRAMILEEMKLKALNPESGGGANDGFGGMRQE